MVNNYEIQTNYEIYIYPNPTNNNFLNVNLQYKTNFELINLTGQILRKGIFNSETNTLYLEPQIPNGLYFLKIDGKSCKVVVER